MSTHISGKGWSLVHTSYELRGNLNCLHFSGEGIEVSFWRNCPMASHQRDVQSLKYGGHLLLVLITRLNSILDMSVGQS